MLNIIKKNAMHCIKTFYASSIHFCSGIQDENITLMSFENLIKHFVCLNGVMNRFACGQFAEARLQGHISVRRAFFRCLVYNYF